LYSNSDRSRRSSHPLAVVAQELRRIRESSTEQRVVEQPAAPIAELQGVDWGRFVGRQEEMDQLKAALENALFGRGSLVMIVGEPDIGKTRLAEEFGVYASLRSPCRIRRPSSRGTIPPA
jgi:hypothetical protein